ncbi:MAG: hypothetical protein IPG91_16370 [Ideonella sp.]|nr:hypothetical protein [Ideonella sp.]
MSATRSAAKAPARAAQALARCVDGRQFGKSGLELSRCRRSVSSRSAPDALHLLALGRNLRPLTLAALPRNVEAQLNDIMSPYCAPRLL